MKSYENQSSEFVLHPPVSFFTKFGFDKTHEYFNQNKSIGKNLNQKIKKLKQKLKIQKNLPLYLYDLLKKNDIHKNNFFRINEMIEKINLKFEQEIEKKKINLKKEVKNENKVNHYDLLLKKNMKDINENIGLKIVLKNFKIESRIKSAKNENIYLYHLLKKVEKNAFTGLSEIFSKKENIVKTNLSELKLKIRGFKRDLCEIVNKELEDRYQSPGKVSQKAPQEDFELSQLKKKKEQNSVKKNLKFIKNVQKDVWVYKEHLELKQIEIQKKKDYYSKKIQKRKDDERIRMKEHKKNVILENLNKIYLEKKRRDIHMEQAKKRYSELKKIIPLYEIYEKNFVEKEEELMKTMTSQIRENHKIDFSEIKKHEMKILKNKENLNFVPKEKVKEKLMNRTKSVFLKKNGNFFERKKKAKNFSQYVKKNYLPKLTEGAKLRMENRIELSKEKMFEKYKERMVKKIEVNKKFRHNYLKESLLLINKNIKNENQKTCNYLQNVISENSHDFAKNQNILRNSIYYKNYLENIPRAKKKQEKNIFSVLKELKQKKKDKENLSEVRNDLEFVENEADRNLNIYNNDIVRERQLKDIDKVYVEIMRTKLELIKNLY